MIIRTRLLRRDCQILFWRFHRWIFGSMMRARGSVARTRRVSARSEIFARLGGGGRCSLALVAMT